MVIVLVAAALELLDGPGIGQLRGSTAGVPFAVVLTATAAVYATLLVRWRHPTQVYGVLWFYSMAGLVLPRFTPFVGLLIALHAVATRLSARRAAAALVLAAVPLAVNAVNGAAVRTGPTGSAVSAAGQFVLYAVLAAAAWGIGRLSFSAAARAEERQRQSAIDATRSERLRLARELHDIVSHAVSGMLLQAAGARALITDTERVRQSLTLIEQEGVQAMNELHKLLGLLRAVDDGAEPAEPGQQPSLDDLGELVDQSRRSGVDVTLTVAGTPRALDPSVSLAGYRVVQEGLTNAVKYGGPRVRVQVELAWAVDRLSIQVRDRPDPTAGPWEPTSVPSSGQGLRGLAERMALVGAHFEAGPVADGFLLSADLPCTAPEASSGRPQATAVGP